MPPRYPGFIPSWGLKRQAKHIFPEVPVRSLLESNRHMRMPVLFVGHGSPMNAIEENAFTHTLASLSQKLPRPKAVCVISAHWVTPGSEVLAVDRPRTIHDFSGFPKLLYDVQYPAPGAPGEAQRLVADLQLMPDHHWGFDHGAWSVLKHLYPQADIPVFQISLDHSRSFASHLALGRELSALRDRGVLILGSGNLVHNLRLLNGKMDAPPFSWALEFDEKIKTTIEQRDEKSLTSPDRWGAALLGKAHPTLEHYVPILYCMGSTNERDDIVYPYEGFDYGSISMRMVLFGNR